MSKRSYERRIRAKREAARAARKRAERMRKIRVAGSILAALALAAVLLIVFLGRDKDVTPAANPTPSGAQIAGCTQPAGTPSPNGKTFPSPPAMTIDTNKIYVATMETSCGVVKFRMDPKTAPRSTNSFVYLARQGFFDNTKIGRVQNTSEFAIVQAGTQTGTISGGAGYSYAGETPAPTTRYTRGTVAMANSGGPSSNGSQFFIVVRDWPTLPKNYTVLGKTDDAISLGALDRMIQAKGPDIQGGGLGITPNPPIYILKVTIEELNRG